MENMCYYPWVGMDIDPQGNIKPCCWYENDIDSNIDTYFNNPELKKLQDEFSQGLKPAGCSQCWNFEKVGKRSKRQIDWEFILEKTIPDLNKIKILSLPFGNSCNLACRSCSSANSTTWIKEEENLKKSGIDIKIHDHKRFYQDKKFMQQVKDLCSDVVQITFPGGEPFLAGITEHLDFLDFLLDNNPQNIKLYYITNGTIFPKQEFWEKWKKFKYINLLVSVDGLDEQFNYLRWPGKWDQVKQNIGEYKDKIKVFDNIKFEINHTVSVFNIYYLPEFVMWCLKNNLGYPNFNVLIGPEEYCIQHLPTPVKRKIEKKLENLVKFKDVIEFMNEKSANEKYYKHFVEITNILDQQRNQSIEKTFPEFYQLLKDAECQI